MTDDLARHFYAATQSENPKAPALIMLQACDGNDISGYSCEDVPWSRRGCAPA